MANVIGPYAVIVVAALVGGSWALSRRERTQLLNALLFLVLISATAAMLTTGLAVWVSRRTGDVADVSWLMAPIALVIGAVGHDWTRVGRWLMGRMGRLIDKKIDTNTPPSSGATRDE